MKTPKVKRRGDMNRQVATPMQYQRNLRAANMTCLTSMPAGKVVPLKSVWLHREDGVRRGKMVVNVEMEETAQVLMNAVNLELRAYFVPALAFSQFQGMDDFNKSYKGIPLRDGEQPIPFFETLTRAAHGSEPILEYLGLHVPVGAEYNSVHVKAYNQIWNHRAKNRSEKITLRDENDKTLAPAFANHDRYRHIVPTIDIAERQGEVALQIAEARMPVTGIGKHNQNFGANVNAYQTGGSGVSSYSGSTTVIGSDLDGRFYVEEDPNNPGYPGIFAELDANAITVFLSDIDQAKRTAFFARMKEQYSGLEDEEIVELLMDGIRVPDQALKQPWLLDRANTVIGMTKRNATDGANLTEHVAEGFTQVSLNIAMPPVTTGGIIMVVAEAAPDQIFERQEDPILTITDPAELPNRVTDELDIIAAEPVYCNYIDQDHDNPDTLFGYAPKNHKWDDHAVRVGGRHYRPEVDAAFDEDRQFIWANEVQNPTLAEDFYVLSEVHQRPFAFTTIDPFRVTSMGYLYIDTLTVMGAALIEAQGNYADIVARQPTELEEAPSA